MVTSAPKAAPRHRQFAVGSGRWAVQLERRAGGLVTLSQGKSTVTMPVSALYDVAVGMGEWVRPK